jgi:rubredoxin
MPGRIPIEDLPKEWRRKISGGGPASQGAGRADLVGPVETTARIPTPWRCPTCGATGDTAAGLDRHADTERHYRIDTVW